MANTTKKEISWIKASVIAGVILVVSFLSIEYVESCVRGIHDIVDMSFLCPSWEG